MKNIIVGIVIFVVVFILVYSIASGGFGRFIDRVFPGETPLTRQELMTELLGRNFDISPFWLDRYGAYVESEEDAVEDADKDGLTLRQEYTYLTNPFVPDSDGDGYTDGEEITNGYSPIGEGLLDNDHNGLPDKWEQENSLSTDGNVKEADADNDGLSNLEELQYGTDPNNADTDGDGYNDATEIKNGYDPVAPGDARPSVRIEIDGIGVDAPVILSKDADETSLQKDLQKGVIHYPGMAMPGQRGNVYIAGHSSNYLWSKGNYNNIFKDLVNVKLGDTIRVISIFANAKAVTHTYVVEEQREAEADDPEIFEETQSEILTLTTCWPLGTADRRIMVKAKPVTL